jgi:hypothetical protein
MSEWPQLEHRLVESARRQSRWRRTARTAVAAVPVALALAVVAVLVTDSPTPQRIPRDERAVPSPTATATPTVAGDGRSSPTPLQRFYGVFRSPQTAQDQPPNSAKLRDGLTVGCGAKHGTRVCLRLETGRLVYSAGDLQIFLMQGKRADDLCNVTFERGHFSTMGCTTANASRIAKPSGAYDPPRGSQPARGYTVFPDGVERVAYTLADGTMIVRDVERNLAYITAPAAITSLSWISGKRRYVEQVADFDPNHPAVKASCPKLAPLPEAADEPATQAARIAASVIYAVTPGEITLSHVRPATIADVDRTRRGACGDALVERSLVVDLTFSDHRPGSLLVGFRDGSPIVWAQIG